MTSDPWKRLARLVNLLRASLATVALLLTGCAGLESTRGIPGPEYIPANVHVASSSLPPGIRRVALLPLSVTDTRADPEMVRESLQPVFQGELIKAGRFEVVTVSPSRLQEWTGRPEWLASEELPPDLLTRLGENTGCDAVLFAQITEYRAYRPVAVGFRLQLVDVTQGMVWWAADEVIDSHDPVVANSARRYHLSHAARPRKLTDPDEILTSPRRFARYAAGVLIATCPSP